MKLFVGFEKKAGIRLRGGGKKNVLSKKGGTACRPKIHLEVKKKAGWIRPASASTKRGGSEGQSVGEGMQQEGLHKSQKRFKFGVMVLGAHAAAADRR